MNDTWADLAAYFLMISVVCAPLEAASKRQKGLVKALLLMAYPPWVIIMLPIVVIPLIVCMGVAMVLELWNDTR